jgi:hypothetical protein
VNAARSAFVALGTLLVLTVPPAAADSFTPVRLTTALAPVARLRARLPVTVTVSADPGVLDGHLGLLRIAVKLAPECGGTFETTPGVTLMDSPLSPQPAAGQAYSATASGSGRPQQYGVQVICTFLEDTGVDRVYANDESGQVDVSGPCTAAGRHFDAAQRALDRARRQLRDSRPGAKRRRLQRIVKARTRVLRRDRRQGVAVCGRGVKL